MLISVCKMIQRVRGRSPSGTPAKSRHCVEVRAGGLACFSAVLAVQLYKGCTKLSVANVFSSTQTLKCILLLPLNIILFHVIIFCSIMFLMLYKMFQKIETSLFKSTLEKKMYTSNHFIHFYRKHHNNQNLLCFFELSIPCT